MRVSTQNSKPGFPELRGSIDHIKYPAWAEVKLDGEFCYIVYTGNHTTTINKYGKVREDFPALNAIGTRLKLEGVRAAILLAELYTDEGKLGALYDLLGRKEDDNLNLKCYDILQIDDTEITDKTLLDRKETLISAIGNLAIAGIVVESKDEALSFFNMVTKAGFEGIVLKNFDSTLVIGPCSWAKMKFKDRTDYPVAKVDSSKEKITVFVPHPNLGALHMVEVGVKAPNRYKKHIKAGDMVTIEHQGVLKSGSLRHPVLIKKPEWK